MHSICPVLQPSYIVLIHNIASAQSHTCQESYKLLWTNFIVIFVHIYNILHFILVSFI